MAAVKQTIKTPLVPLQWVEVRGRGKLGMNKEDNGDPANYSYVAQAVLTKEQADAIQAKVNDFWKKNKPKGLGKRKFELVKEELVSKKDANGNVLKDEDDEPIKEPTGKYLINAKTMTQWPDGKPVNVKILGSTGKELPEDHPAVVDGIGNGTMGIIHGALGISAYPGNEGVVMYLSGVQIKDSTLTAKGDDAIEAEEIEDDVADTEVDTSQGPEV